MKKTTYMYPYVGQGRASIAIRYTPKFDGDQEAEMSVAFCAPGDQFCRRDGRNLVNERLLSGKYVVLPIAKGAHIKQAAVDLLKEMLKSNLAPSWTRKHVGTVGDDECSSCYIGR